MLVQKTLRKKQTIPALKSILALTLCHWHCTPADAPTRICNTAVSLEVQLDSVACADDGVGRQGGAAPLLHQGGAVAISDGQVVVVTCFVGLNVKCSELQRQDQPLFHFYCLCLPQVFRIKARVVW